MGSSIGVSLCFSLFFFPSLPRCLCPLPALFHLLVGVRRSPHDPVFIIDFDPGGCGYDVRRTLPYPAAGCQTRQAAGASQLSPV